MEERPGYLHVRVTGTNSVEAVQGYLGEIYVACVERGRCSILIEEHLRGRGLDLLAIFQIVCEGGERLQALAHRIAYVDVNGEHPAQDMQFAETVAVNRGVNLRVFATVPEAAAWLTESASSRR